MYHQYQLLARIDEFKNRIFQISYFIVYSVFLQFHLLSSCLSHFLFCRFIYILLLIFFQIFFFIIIIIGIIVYNYNEASVVLC